MVLGVFAKEAFKYGAKAFTRYYRLEGKAFNRLYTGFPQSKTIGRGVRHGLTAGSIAGSLITDAGDTPGNNGIQKKTKYVYPPRSSDKTRSRYTRSKYRRCPSGPRPSKYY